LVDGKGGGSTAGKPLADDHICGKFVQSFGHKTHPFFWIGETVHKLVIFS
jgi:hypothetical protein